MAKATFHKGQRVYVRTVGTWAQIEAVLPQWVKGVEEPLRITYDVGLGRDFAAHELQGEVKEVDRDPAFDPENWRLMRLAGRLGYVKPGADANAAVNGTFPVIVTDERDWGGWRVPAAEYDRDPERVEQQARVIAQAMRMKRVVQDLARMIDRELVGAPAPVLELARQAEQVLADIYAADDAAPILTPGRVRDSGL